MEESVRGSGASSSERGHHLLDGEVESYRMYSARNRFVLQSAGYQSHGGIS